jgi:hypothetical protein
MWVKVGVVDVDRRKVALLAPLRHPRRRAV